MPDDNVLVDCPEHPGAHWAAMDVYPSPTAGYWECPRGDSDYCDHQDVDWDVESVEDWPTGPMDNSTPYDVYVCSQCGQTIPFDIANPAEDAHDAMVDAQIDEMRGK